MTPELTHIDDDGAATMVDVAHKTETSRIAVAHGHVRLSSHALSLVKKNQIKKGDVLACARIAGIMAAKQTPALIPLCHHVRLSSVKIDFEYSDSGIYITVMAKAQDRTGVEMEALCGLSLAALTIYDMCKAVDRAIEIGPLKLIKKTGGASGDYRAPKTEP